MTDIYIATHKKLGFNLPPIYKWVQVNAEKNGSWVGYLHDSDGENISCKNESYCELTVLYRLWKQSKAEIQGLCHYRRFLGKELTFSPCEIGNGICIKPPRIGKNVITESSILTYLQDTDILLPRDIGPYPFTVFEDLQRFVFLKDIVCIISVIEEEYPEYRESLWTILGSKNISYCNIFISRREFVDQYCKWLFTLLEKIEKKINISDYDKNHKRVFGYLAEVLMNIFIHKNNIRTKTLNLLNLDEVPGPISFKRRLWLFKENIFTVFGKPAWGSEYQHRRARFDYFKKREESQPYYDSKSLCSYFQAIGSERTLRHEDDEGNVKIYSKFKSFRIMAFIVKERDMIPDILIKASEFREENQCFGEANITRAYVAFNPSMDDNRQAVKAGITLFPIKLD